MFEHASATSCLFQDDLDGLNALYPPACATAVREPRCVEFSPNSGWKRLLILLVAPLVASLSPDLLLALLLRCRRQRSPHAAKGIFENAAFINSLARVREYKADESLRCAKRTARVSDSFWDGSLGRSSRSDSSCISVSAVAADLVDDMPDSPTFDISQFGSAPVTQLAAGENVAGRYPRRIGEQAVEHTIVVWLVEKRLRLRTTRARCRRFSGAVTRENFARSSAINNTAQIRR
ncbi:hypothetical protein T492DRAFT_1129170 [Pavlovales sp. CCMP2436]|nr:hypothetical protein T492DRAFT_1129170 [Pavlovales sp. CCMP2436]